VLEFKTLVQLPQTEAFTRCMKTTPTCIIWIRQMSKLLKQIFYKLAMSLLQFGYWHCN